MDEVYREYKDETCPECNTELDGDIELRQHDGGVEVFCGHCGGLVADVSLGDPDAEAKPHY